MSPDRLATIFDLAHEAFHLALRLARFFLDVPSVPNVLS